MRLQEKGIHELRSAKDGIRVLTTIFDFWPRMGGAENVAYHLVSNTNDRGTTNGVLTVSTEEVEGLCGGRFIRSERPGNRFQIERFRLLHIQGREKNGRYAKYPNLGIYVANLIRLRNGYDLIHAHTYYWPAVACIIAGRICGKKVVVTGHNTLKRYTAQIERGEFPRWAISILRHCDAYVAISRGIETECRKILKLDGSKVRYIPNGIDDAVYHPPSGPEERRKLRGELGLPADIPLIVYHGRLEPHKNVEALIRSVAVLRAGSVAVRALVMGRGSHTAALKDLAGKLGIAESVIFLPFKQNADEYLRCSDIYCLPSFYEGHPLALLEAMSSGLVCLASDIDGNRDIISSGRDGILFDPSAADGLPDTVSRALAGGEEFASMRRAAREKVRAKFSLTAMVNAYRELYSEMARLD
ncbi:MAG: glycosyltransferase family 4 protein [Desulfobacteraceae bacterium]|nr:glycosyltransferase family 4 protein [Desulfobacteraceae bacterium]